MERKECNKRIESDKEMTTWFEIFTQGDIWLMHISRKTLYAYTTNLKPSDFNLKELVDNGVSDVEERAKILGLTLKKVYR